MKLLIASDIHGSSYWCRKLTERITAEAASRSNDILTDAKQKSEEKLRRAGELGSSMIREFESITQSYTRRIRDEFSPEQQRPNDPTLSSDIIESSGI